MKRIVIISTALVLALLAFNPLPVSGGQAVDSLGLQLIDSSEHGISMELQIPWQSLRLEEEVVEGKTYLKASLPGASQSSQPGAPDLPVVLANLGVPFDVELEVSVTLGNAHEKTLSAPILPVETEQTTRQFYPDQLKLQDAYSTQSSFIEDAAIYKSASPFPANQAALSQDAVVRQQRIVGVQLFPLQYQALAEKLIVYESLLVEIRFLGEFAQKDQAELTPESEVYESFFRESLLNYESAKDWRSFQSGQENVSVQSAGTMWSPPENSWRIQVRQDGMYRMTYEELETAGLPVATLDPSTLQMYHLGTEIAVLVESALVDQFSPGDSIVFYGEEISSKYTRDNVYWLTFGHTQGLRMEIVNGTPGTNPSAENYLETQHSEQNLNYINYIPSEDDFEHFMGKSLMPHHPNPSYRTISISFNLDHIFDGSGLLRLSLLGYLNALHQASVSLNGTLLPDNITWNAFEMINPEISLPTGSLMEGVNTVVISSTNTQDLYYLDWMELVYTRDLVSTNDTLLFDYAELGNWNFSIEGFSVADLNLFDVSSPDLVKQITDFSVELTEATYKLEFASEIVAAKRFWSGTSISYLEVELIVQDVPSDWQSSTNGADYIVIAHSAFIDQASELAQFRASQDLRVQVVDVQDLYDEFGYGIRGSEPIRAFLSFAYGNWESPAPSYAVLIGDGHFDPKNYMGYGRQSYIPPYLASVDPELGETAADNRYVAFVGEDVFPDMMLGRLAINTTADAQGFVDKIIAYEEFPETNDWNRQVLAVSDSYDSGWPFPFLSDELLRCCLPSSYEASRVYLEVTHANLVAAREAILEGINAGKLLVNYIGHAAASQWSSAEVIGGSPVYGVLNVNDIASLNNLNKYPVILSMTCWDGYYVYPNPTGGFYEAMAEVFTKAANKGAVAAWSPTGMGVARGHEYLNQGFFNAVFRDGLSDLGQATSYGKLYLWSSRENLDLMDTYLLFGDPALSFNRRTIAVPDTYVMNEDEILEVPDADGVLENDINPKNLSLTAEFVDGDGPFNGTLTAFNPDGSFSYTPNADFFGTDSFTYRIYDGSQYSNAAMVTITVNSINDPPVADSQTVITNEDTPIDITLTASDDGDGGGTVSSQRLLTSQYLENQLNEEALIFTVLDPGPEHGMLSGEAPNLTYTPDSDYNGPDSFTFTANDGEYDSDIATVSITITAVNDAPAVGNIPDQTIAEGETFTTISLDNYVSDVDNSDLEMTWTYTGNVELSMNVSTDRIATISIPDIDWNGSETITFRATDIEGLFDEDAATFTVHPVNDAPVAVNDSYTTSEDTTLTVMTADGVLDNDSDAEGDSLTAIKVTDPSNGSLILNADGSFTYTPNSNYNGSDSFTYKDSDGTADSNIATVTITVTALNDAPMAANDSYSTSKDTELTVSAATGVLKNDSDIDGNDLTAVWVADPFNGSLTLNADGSFTYTPDSNFFGTDSFTYKANDGMADSNIATVTITILEGPPRNIYLPLILR